MCMKDCDNVIRFGAMTLNSTMFHSFSSHTCVKSGCKIVLGDLDADICRLPHAPWSCVPVKKKILVSCALVHVSCALVHVCMKFLIEYTDGVDELLLIWQYTDWVDK